MDRRATSRGYPGFVAVSRTGSTPRCSSAASTRSCAAARGPPARGSSRPTFRNWDYPQRRQIFSGFRIAKDADDEGAAATPATSGSSRGSSELDERSLANDVLDGLTRPFKELPPKHFYDARGSELFEQICELPEYYPTRTETDDPPRAGARDRRGDRRRRARRARLRRRGQGADPARRDGATPARCRRYVPLDVSETVVEDAARQLVERVRGPPGPWGDRRLRAPPRARSRRPTASRGSSRCSAARSATSRRARAGGCCARSRALLGAEDRLLLGTDLVKDPARDRGRLRRFARGHRRVQPQRAARDQPRARRRLRRPRPSITSRSSTAATSGSRCGCARAGRAPS